MSDHSELKEAATRIVEVQTSQDVPISKLFDEFDALASPEAVLAMIGEVEGFRAQHSRDSAELRILSKARDDARKERDQLKVEVERLTADNSSLRGSCAKLGAEHAGMVRQIKKLKGAKP